MRPIEILVEEHRDIERMLERALAAIEPLDLDGLDRIVEFFVDFVDGVHAKKEEEVLFPEITQHAMDMAVGPIHVMHKEHDMARAYLRAAREAMPRAAVGSSSAADRVRASIRAYVALMQAHVKKEDNILFALGERTIPASHERALLQRFEQVQIMQMDNETYERWRRTAKGIQNEPTSPFDRHAVPTQPMAKGAAQLDARSLGAGEPTEEELEATAMHAGAGRVIYADAHHRCVLLHDFGRGLSVQANQFLIVDSDEGMLLDPGGPKVYPHVLAETQLILGERKLRYIFLSHQDPDIGTSINAWMLDTDADAYISKLWMRFLPHYGIDSLLEHRLVPIPDQGAILPLGQTKLMIVPAHFLHSAGNFQVYDPVAKVLFTGDLGASVGMDYRTVTDFDAHVRHMIGFHRRYMTSNAAMRAWADMVQGLDIEIIAPQHGAMFKGKEMVRRFIDWCRELQCGVDLMGDYFQLPRE